MNEIIYLEPDEEITSVIDKLKQSKTGRLNLVVPREATLLQSVVNLKLLLKEAESLGKEIAIITADKIGRNLAAQVGITVFESVKDQQPIYQPPAPEITSQDIIEIDAQERLKQPPQKPKGLNVHHFQEGGAPDLAKVRQQFPAREKPEPIRRSPIFKNINWRKTLKIILYLVIIGSLLGLGSLIFIWPKVNIKIKVKAEDYQQSLETQISGNDVLPGEDIYKGTLIELNQNKEEKFPTTGKKNLGGKASGTLTIYNKMDSNTHAFSAGTKLSSLSKTFILKKSVSVPGATVQFPNIVPGAVSAEIEAENPGEDYNVKAGRFTIIGLSSAQQEAIYGQSSNDLSGGFTKEVKIVSQTDYDQAKDKVSKELIQELQDKLAQDASGMVILEKAVQTEEQAVETSANVNAEANEFTLKIKERLRVIVYQQSDFEKFVVAQIEKQIPYDKMITFGANDKIDPIVDSINYDQKLLKLKINITGKLTSRLDINKIKKDLKSKNNTQAEQYLQNINGVEGFEIKYWPSWWLKRIPSYKKALTIGLEYLGSNEAEIVPETSPKPEGQN